MGFTTDNRMVRVDFFKESSKWYTTEAVLWTGRYDAGVPRGTGIAKSQAMKTKYLDCDNRRSPKTDLHCCACHKDLHPGAKIRWVHWVDGGPFILHPDDEATYTSDAGDMGCFPIGMDCARKLGLEWTHSR